MARNPDAALRLAFRHDDYFHKALTFRWPAGLAGEEIPARVCARQPHGFTQEIDAVARRQGEEGEITFVYPLLDEGCYASRRSKDVEGRAPWGMGRYRFEVKLGAEDGVPIGGQLSLDPNGFFGAIGGRRLAQVDSVHQFIECCPARLAFIDTSVISFTIRTLPERVAGCEAEVDVVRPTDRGRVCDPIAVRLDGEAQHHSFDATGWARGEYWLRVRVRGSGMPVPGGGGESGAAASDGQGCGAESNVGEGGASGAAEQPAGSVGACLLRQFFVEVPRRPARPHNPLRPGHAPLYMVDDWIYERSAGLRHVPDQLEPVSDGPIADIDRPWEQGPDHLPIESFSYDAEQRQFHALYQAGPLSGDSRLWEMGVRSTMTAYSTRYLCLAVSSDGVHWEKPELGIVEFDGSKRNNILRDKAGEEELLSGEFDSFPVPVKERLLPRKYRYRFYDPDHDGPVEMDNYVFRVFLDETMEGEEQFEGGFRPKHRDFWGFERRGDTFLALTRQPVLTGGRGMHLKHTNERASTYPFEGDPMALFQPTGRSTCTYYHRNSKTFFYYYRPDGPAYPPNGKPYYLWHKVAAIRTRAVAWTRDGRHWERCYMTMPDEHDPPGTTLYGFGFITPAGQQAGGTDNQLFFGGLLNWDLTTQRMRQHLMWSRDLINWQKFGANRRPLLENGPIGAWNTSCSGLSSYHAVTGADGEEEWLFPFTGSSSRYMLGVARECASVEELREKFPYFALVSYFTTWEEILEEARNTRVLTGLARCRAGRLAHVEPVDGRGGFTTLPMVVEGSRLEINAATDDGGAVRVEVQDGEGNPFPELGLVDCAPFAGDRVAHQVRWRRARFAEVSRRVVRLRFELTGARLYAFRIAG